MIHPRFLSTVTYFGRNQPVGGTPPIFQTHIRRRLFQNAPLSTPIECGGFVLMSVRFRTTSSAFRRWTFSERFCRTDASSGFCTRRFFLWRLFNIVRVGDMILQIYGETGSISCKLCTPGVFRIRFVNYCIADCNKIKSRIYDWCIFYH